MAAPHNRTHDWVLELSSLPSFETPTHPATPTSDSIDLPRWSSEITPGEGSPTARRSRSPRPPSVRSEPLPGAAECLTFVKTRSGRFRASRQTQLRNNLQAAVGFLEVANACDIAANVWNQTPVPIYAMVLMAIGATIALCMIYFCIKDGRLSYANLRALRQERLYLRAQRRLFLDDPNMLRTIDCFLDMNTREMGTEIVDRIGLDTLLGFSALIVSLGTFMAMNGDHNESVFRASNLLTGYLGNTPPAIFGLVNAGWSSYVWIRSRKQQKAALNYVKGSTRMSQMLRNRTSSIQMHAALNGFTGLVAGAAALITATMWWGYVVLAPCIVTSGIVNIFWRRRVGYERPLVAHQINSIDHNTVFEALRYAEASRRRIMYGQNTNNRDAFTTLVAQTDSILCALDVIRKNNLFENFCIRMLEDKELWGRVAVAAPESMTPEGPTIDWHSLAATEDAELVRRLLALARDLINEQALRSFMYQERHLLEVLGCYMCRGANFSKGKKKRKSQATSTYGPNLNVHTYAGRHANDWLFGGFSLTNAVKSLFGR